MMRLAKLMIVPALLLLSGGFNDVAAQDAKAAAPDTVVMDRSPVGTVTFSHAEHQTMTDCVACHHESRPAKPLTDDPYQECAVCHVSDPAPPMTTSLRDAFHDRRGQSGICIDCHKEESSKGTDAPVQCNACHIRSR